MTVPIATKPLRVISRQSLARALRWRNASLVLVCLWLTAVGPVSAQGIPPEYQAVLKTLGKGGDVKDGVLKVNIPRNDVRVTIGGGPAPTPFGFGGWIALTKDDGGHDALINARMGLNTWAAFAGSDADAMVAGDIAMLDTEVTPVLNAPRANGLNAVALHHHMTGVAPTVSFVHYFGTGQAAALAKGVRAAVDLLGKR